MTQHAQMLINLYGFGVLAIVTALITKLLKDRP